MKIRRTARGSSASKFGLLVLTSVVGTALSGGVRAEIPAVRLNSAPLVTPTQAWSFYGSSTVHTNGATAWSTAAPEVQAVARGLGAERVVAQQLSASDYADRVNEYVRNNIEVDFRFGLGKGARGAIIDQSGTVFDQAQLMVQLLRAANVPVEYKVGTITLDAQQFGQWTGLVTGLTQATPPTLPTFTVNAKAACQFLADGGIPATVNSASGCTALTGNLTTVTLGHAWVAAAGKLYDPAFKRYNLRAGIDLPQRMGCGTAASPTCATLVTNAALSGATSGTLGSTGAATLTNLNETQIGTQLQSFAVGLQNYVQANLPDADLEDVIGGRLLDKGYAPAAAASLPYPSTVQYSWSGEVPDQFRTRMSLKFAGTSPVLFGDELYGRRIELLRGLESFELPDSTLYLIIDDGTLTYPYPAPPDFIPRVREFEATIDHPYAANAGSYADLVRGWAFGGRQGLGSQGIFFALGETGAGMPRHYGERQHGSPQTTYLVRVDSFGNVEFRTGAANTLESAQLLYQQSLAVRALEGVSKTRITQHHAFGMTLNTSEPLLDPNGNPVLIPGPGYIIVGGDQGGANFFSLESKYSVSSPSNDATARSATFETLALAGAMLEGSVMQQQSDAWRPVTTASLFSFHNGKRVPFVEVTPQNLSAVLPQLQNYGNPAVFQGPADEGYSFILPRNQDLGAVAFDQHFYFTIGGPMLTYRGDSIAYNVGFDIKGGGAQGGAEDPIRSALDSVKPSERGLRRRDALSVNLATGDFTLAAPPDLVTGAGEFPFSLPFQRTYVSTNTFAEVLPRGQDGGVPPLVLPSEYYGSDQNSFARLGGGWTYNYQISAVMTNDGATGLGMRRGLDAVAAIAGLYALHDLAKTPSFSRRLTASLASNWVSDRFINNVVNIERALNLSTFVRLPSGAFQPPRGSAEQLVQDRQRLGPYCLADCNTTTNPGVRILEPATVYDYGQVAFTYTDAIGSKLVFSASQYSQTFSPRRTFYKPTFVVDNWTFANGVRVQFDYQALFGEPLSFNITKKRVLTKVSNSLGRSLTFTSVADVRAPYLLVGSAGAGQLTAVTDETGRKVTFERSCTPPIPGAPEIPGGPFGPGPYGCKTLEVITPDNARTVYNYEPGVGSPTQNSLLRANYRLRRWFTPDDLGTPFITIDYDDLYRVRRVTEKSGAGSDYFVGALFDEQHKRGEVRDALGGVNTRYFDIDGRVLASIDALGRATYNNYDTAGRVVKTTFPERNAVTYTYDARSNRLTTTLKAKPDSGLTDVVTRATYPATCSSPATCNQPMTITDARGQVTSYTYNNSTGQVLTVSSPSVPLGSGTGTPLTTFCYTTFNIPGTPAVTISLLAGQIDRVNATTNRVSRYTYNTSNKYVLASGIVDPTTTFSPPATSSPTCTSTTKSGALNLTTALTFDAVGNIAAVDGPRPGTSDKAISSFDTMRRLTRLTAPLGSITRYDYLIDGLLSKTHRAQVLNPDDSNPAHWLTEARDYNATGDLKSITDPEGNRTQFTYDALGRQTLVTDPDERGIGTVFDLAGQRLCIWKGWSSATAPTSCAWDPATYVNNNYEGAFRYAAYSHSLNGRETRVQDANNNITDYGFDGFDREVFELFPDPATGTRCTLTPPVTGSTVPSCTGGQTYVQSSFDANGNRLTLRTRKGDATTWTYDNGNRIRTKTVAGVPMGLPTTTYGYNLLDQPLLLTSPASGSIPAHSIAYDYDAAGRPQYEDNLLNGTTRRVSYQYDEAGNRTRTTWPDGYFTSAEYDVLRRLSTVWEGAPNTTKLAEYSYDVLSRRKQLQYAGQTSNRVTYAYEPDGNLDLLGHVLNSVNLNFDYAYNKSGQIKSLTATDQFFVPTPATASTAYVPDKLNRYASVAGQASTYDTNGNLLTWFNAGGKQTYTYDVESRLRTVAVNGSSTATITYDYDPLGRRLSKKVDGVSTFYLLDGDEEVGEYDAAGNVLRRYITGPAVDDRIAAAEGSGTTSPPKTYYHTNHQGSVIAMTDAIGKDTACAAGLNCQRLAYDDYGLLGAGSIAAGQPYRYTGRRFDAETGLYYYRARHYSPELGRFLQADPIGYDDDFNLYAYVGSDPVNKVDPSGTEGETCVKLPCVPKGKPQKTTQGGVDTGHAKASENLMAEMQEAAVARGATVDSASYHRDAKAATGGGVDSPKKADVTVNTTEADGTKQTEFGEVERDVKKNANTQAKLNTMATKATDGRSIKTTLRNFQPGTGRLLGVAGAGIGLPGAILEKIRNPQISEAEFLARAAGVYDLAVEAGILPPPPQPTCCI